MLVDMKEKVQKLRGMGIDPYPYTYGQTHFSEGIKSDYSKHEGKEVSVAGRIISKRSFGKLMFMVLQDNEGRIQVALTKDNLGKDFAVAEMLDASDMIGVKGKVGKTKLGEISVFGNSLTVLAKAVRPLPEKFHGLKDTEVRYRKRHLDLIVNPEVKRIFKIRSTLISSMRAHLDGKGFIEIETPTLQPIYGGAAAKPFKTYHNALDANLFLRISNELYLKRLLIGGFDKVYEFVKDFRNEDIDSTHNPEFTQVEVYEAYTDYNGMMKLTEEMLSDAVKKIFGTTKINYQGKELDFAPPYKRISFAGEIKAKSGIDVLAWKTDEEAMKVARELKLEVSKETRSRVIDAMFDHYVAPDLWAPTFVCDYPDHMCPLTKKKRGDPRLAERFEMFIAGKECANSYSELTDPIEQREKLMSQEEDRKRGDEEAQPWDEEFLQAIEQGMPPTGGIGYGIDRIVMILTDTVSIKEVIPFPSMRPQDKAVKELEEETEDGKTPKEAAVKAETKKGAEQKKQKGQKK